MPEIIDLFSPMGLPRGVLGADASAINIPGMSPETVGAFSVVSLSSAGTRSVRMASDTGAQQRLRIALPHDRSVVCAFTPERRDSGVVVMRGSVEGNDPVGRCNLYEENGHITGDIEVDAGRFAIVPLGSADAHAVVEVKTQAFPNERQMGKD